VSPLDVSNARFIDSDQEWAAWLAAHGTTEAELVIAIYKKSSGRQTVGFETLLETALAHGWVDTQTKSIDDDSYAIRWVRRRPGPNWSERNRAIAKRLIEEGRMTPAGHAALPADL
jgi:uncharacterized protein YdeI (YjbR/CyaY-like superfamily)